MTIPRTYVVDRSFVQLFERVMALAMCHTGRLFVMIFLRVVPHADVVALFQSSQYVHFQAFNRLDVNSSFYRTTEVVSVCVRLFEVRSLDRVRLTRTVRLEIARFIVLIVDRIRRVQGSCLLEVTAVEVVLVVHVREVVLQLEPTLQCFLVSSELSDDLVTVGVERETFSILVVQRTAVAEVPCYARECNVMIGDHCCRLHSCLHPVGIIALAVRVGVDNRFDLTAREGLEVTKLLRSSKTGVGARSGNGYISAVLYVQLRSVTAVGCTTLGRDQDDTVVTTCTVDSSCRTVLEDIHRCDVFRRYVIDIVRRDTIDDVQRFVSRTAQGRETTDLNVVTGRSRVRGRTADIQTGNFTLDQTDCIRFCTDVEVLCFHRSDRTGDLFFLLGSITNGYHFLQHMRVLYETDHHAFLGNGGLCLEAHVADLQLGTFRNIEFEVTVEICNHTIGCTDLKDAGADSRIARRLQNGTLNLRLHGYAEQQRKCHQTEGKCFVFHNDC